MAASRSAIFTGVLLLLAGIYQFSPLKRMCLARCRTPMGFLLGEWRPGPNGAWIMGLRHGLFCLGCCWALMVLLFVGGVMNLTWVAALAIAVALEKMWPGGERLATWLGLVLMALGTARLLMLWFVRARGRVTATCRRPAGAGVCRSRRCQNPVPAG